MPALVGDTVTLIWVSLVPVDSLDSLLGRDLLDVVGAVLGFPAKTLACQHLDGGLINLGKMQAGHFLSEMIPEQWPTLKPFRWRKLGLDGVLELQATTRQWLQQRLGLGHAPHRGASSCEREHLLTENSLKAARLQSSDFTALHAQASEAHSPAKR